MCIVDTSTQPCSVNTLCSYSGTRPQKDVCPQVTFFLSGQDRTEVLWGRYFLPKPIASFYTRFSEADLGYISNLHSVHCLTSVSKIRCREVCMYDFLYSSFQIPFIQKLSVPFLLHNHCFCGFTWTSMSLSAFTFW